MADVKVVPSYSKILEIFVATPSLFGVCPLIPSGGALSEITIRCISALIVVVVVEPTACLNFVPMKVRAVAITAIQKFRSLWLIPPRSFSACGTWAGGRRRRPVTCIDDRYYLLWLHTGDPGTLGDRSPLVAASLSALC